MMSKSFYLLIVVTVLWACGPKPSDRSQDVLQNDVTPETKDSTFPEANEQVEVDTISIMVIPCSNGYEYAMHGYDFNPHLERELDLLDFTDVQAFPLKKMMGVAYHGVFHKRYCGPIVERTDVDYLIMTKFISNQGIIIGTDTPTWGYETKILNTKTMEQMNSIKAENLKSYADIESHIKKNIALLKQDMDQLK